MDFSTYGHAKNDALKSAKDHGDYITIPEELADEFTQTYKQYYPGFLSISLRKLEVKLIT